MTNREVMQMALDALEWLLGEDRKCPLSGPQDAVASLREALAQPEPEPVAWALFRPNGTLKYCGQQRDFDGKDWRPLYLAPPAPEYTK